MCPSVYQCSGSLLYLTDYLYDVSPPTWTHGQMDTSHSVGKCRSATFLCLGAAVPVFHNPCGTFPDFSGTYLGAPIGAFEKSGLRYVASENSSNTGKTADPDLIGTALLEVHGEWTTRNSSTHD